MNSSLTSNTTTNATSDSTKLLGWTPESTGRGTWGIITSCFFTILICTWTAIHPRIHTNSRLARLHKLLQLVKTILVPEMVCVESLQEWVQARKMVKRSAAATEGGLKLVHAFYIGMLGIRYQTLRGHRVLWPGQYTWLLNNGLVKWSDRDAWGLSEELIQDKSKADGLVKLAAVCQVIWFLLQCITREAHGLPIAPLEAMTIAYVFVVILTYLFWWVKPKDITTASFVVLPDMSPDQLRVFEALAMENTYDYEDPDEKKSKNIAWYVVSRDCNNEDEIIEGHTTTREYIDEDSSKKEVTVIEGQGNVTGDINGSGTREVTVTEGQGNTNGKNESKKEATDSEGPNNEDGDTKSPGGKNVTDSEGQGDPNENVQGSDSKNEVTVTEGKNDTVSDDKSNSKETSAIEGSGNKREDSKKEATVSKSKGIHVTSRVVGWFVSDVEKASSVHSNDSMIITQWDHALYYSKFWPLICVLGAAFGALHLISWNSIFPTHFERWLWRAAALVSIVTSIICMQWEKMSWRWDGPLTLVRIISPILYVVSRFVMMGEVFAALRAMPANMFDTYVIWNYWLHFL